MNPECPSRKIIRYFQSVKIRDNWWFSPGYNINFFVGDTAYRVIGFPDGSADFYRFDDFRTKFFPFHYILNIADAALPVNEDFDREFNKLRIRFSKLMMLE
jgi:hypothetical protein